MENNKTTEITSIPQNQEQRTNAGQATNLGNKQGLSSESIKEQASNIAGQAKEKAVGVLDEQKVKVTSGLSSVADSLRQVGENLRGDGKGADQNAIAKTTARYGETLADKIEDLSGYIENATIKDLTRDVERFARRQPALFVGGAFLVGVLAVRFLKTSAPENQNRRNSANR